MTIILIPLGDLDQISRWFYNVQCKK